MAIHTETKPVENRCQTGDKPVSDQMPIAEVLTIAASYGVSVAAETGKLNVKGPKSAAELGKAILARKAEVLLHLNRNVCAGCATGIRITDPKTAEGCGWPACPAKQLQPGGKS